MKTLILFIGSLFFQSGHAGLEVIPDMGVGQFVMGTSAKVSCESSGPGKLVACLQLGCFSQNLRSVSNPVSPDATLTARLKIKKGDNSFVTVDLEYPGDMTQPLTYQKSRCESVVEASNQNQYKPAGRPASGISNGDDFLAFCSSNHIHAKRMHRCRLSGGSVICNTATWDGAGSRYEALPDDDVLADKHSCKTLGYGFGSSPLWFDCHHIKKEAELTYTGIKAFKVSSDNGTPNDLSDDTRQDITGSVDIEARGNKLKVKFEGQGIYAMPGVKNQTTGNYTTPPGQLLNLVDVKFFQDVPSNGGHYMANDGPVSARKSVHVTPDGGLANILAMHPGQNGYCGGFFSPLMLFTDMKQLPSFKGASNFPVSKDSGQIYWMEPNHPGYLLAMDLTEKGLISDGSQLFGNSDIFANGFEALGVHDENKDGKIDKKDTIFSKLYAWKDKNGNGKSDKGEAVKLPKVGVVSIDLKYNLVKPKPYDFQGRAIAREEGSYTYKKGKKTKKGAVLDIYFGSLR